jgi:diketogulonate reductase-like aldo/keto reductase
MLKADSFTGLWNQFCILNDKNCLMNPTIASAFLNNSVSMPLMGLGVYDMHQREAEQAVSEALEIGYRLIDTAAMYQNEQEIGKAINGSNVPRSEIFLTTKLNNTEHGFDKALKAFEKSLKTLQQDYVDLYLIHWPIKMGRKDSWAALEKLYREGRIRAIGVANYTRIMLEELRSYGTIVPAVNQVEFSPWLFQKELLNYCQAHGIQLQAYSPITRGLKFNDPRLIALTDKYQKSAAQLVLRWHLEHGISPIPKSSKKERLLENFDANFFSLEAADVKIMDGFNEGFRICDDPAGYQ